MCQLYEILGYCSGVAEIFVPLGYETDYIVTHRPLSEERNIKCPLLKKTVKERKFQSIYAQQFIVLKSRPLSVYKESGLVKRCRLRRTHPLNKR